MELSPRTIRTGQTVFSAGFTRGRPARGRGQIHKYDRHEDVLSRTCAMTRYVKLRSMEKKTLKLLKTWSVIMREPSPQKKVDIVIQAHSSGGTLQLFYIMKCLILKGNCAIPLKQFKIPTAQNKGFGCAEQTFVGFYRAVACSSGLTSARLKRPRLTIATIPTIIKL
jgi:hypothetical protein